MPLTAHLVELRRRLMIAAVAVGAGFVVCYWQADVLFDMLLSPLRAIIPDAGDLIFTGLTEPFLVYIKTGLVGGFFLALPVIFLQIWLFARPAFRGTEERYASLFVVVGSLLFVVGALFGYLVVFPFGFKFLIEFGGSEFLPYLSIREYFSLATKMLLAFGLMFETPLLLLFLGRLGVIDSRWLRKNRGYALVGFIMLAAILTPPDIVTQLMLAGPLMIMYEASVWLVALLGKPRRGRAEAEEEPAGEAG